MGMVIEELIDLQLNHSEDSNMIDNPSTMGDTDNKDTWTTNCHASQSIHPSIHARKNLLVKDINDPAETRGYIARLDTCVEKTFT